MTRSAATRRYLTTAFVVAATLLAFGLRLVALWDSPPGWRDDELINMSTLSGEPLSGHFPFYFTGASGHEPLYHYLHAGLIALGGYNVLTAHLLSAFFGTLAVPLTFVLVRRLFGSLVAALTTLALTPSFWSLMYSRFGLRHISVVPFALAALYFLWIPADPRPAPRRWPPALGLAIGLSIYIYPAARLLPAAPLLFGLYLALFHRERFRRVWRGYAQAVLLALLIAAPLFIAIRREASDAAAQGIGADARLVELARPVHALREGDPGPLLENIGTTLGMFHATGDPEALYNIPGRPVFYPVAGLLFWAGVLTCLWRWRRPRYFLLLIWLSLGLLPTVLSVPPASLSHSILTLPLACLLPVLALSAAYRLVQERLRGAALPVFALTTAVAFVLPTAYRDLRDYFDRWPRESLVRFLYRADYRDAARYLEHHPETQDWAVGSLLMGPWDRLALETDVRTGDPLPRLFDPQRALVYAGSASPAAVLLTSYPPPAAPVADLLADGRRQTPLPSLTRYDVVPGVAFDGPPLGQFHNGLALSVVEWAGGQSPAPGTEAVLLTCWTVATPLQLPPIPIVANPPPPGVYTGPRLAVFTHLLAPDGGFLAGDDGLWVDPVTLQTGDRFVQLHHFSLPPGAPPGPYTLELGLYDPLTGDRWTVKGTQVAPESDRLLLTVPGR